MPNYLYIQQGGLLFNQTNFVRALPVSDIVAVLLPDKRQVL